MRWGSLSRDVALKIFPPGTLVDESARKRFRKEARALSQLSHPNIATLYDFDTQEGVDFLGHGVHQRPGFERTDSRRANARTRDGAAWSTTAEGLAAAHAVRVVHCDIKPDNLRASPEDGRLKIVDFGLAKITKPPRTDRITTSSVESHTVAGTLPYVAPEQVSSRAARCPYRYLLGGSRALRDGDREASISRRYQPATRRFDPA